MNRILPIALLLTAAIVVLASSLVGLVDLNQASWVRLTVGAAVIVSMPVLASLWLGWRRSAGPTAPPHPLLIVAVGLAARLLLLPADHFLSDDAFRYHWDGKVLVHGINPYAYAPDDAALAHLRTDRIDGLINHTDVVTVYPPLAQLAFAAGHLLSPGRSWGYGVVCLLAELALWGLLIREARRRRWWPGRLIIAAWFPLLIFEGYLPGHTDALALPLMTLFLLRISQHRPGSAGAFLALSCLIKPLPLIFVPAAVRELGWRRSLGMAPAFLIVCALFYLPFVGAGERLFSSMLLMARKWSFNGSVAALLGTWMPDGTLRVVLGIALALWLLVGLRIGRDLWSRCLIAFAGLVIVTPTLYPWYLTWMFPILVFRPDPALLTLAALAPLVDLVAVGYYTDRVWAPAPGPSIVSYVPFYLMLGLGARRGWGMFERAGSDRERDG